MTRRTANRSYARTAAREGLARGDKRQTWGDHNRRSLVTPVAETVLLVGGQPILLDTTERLLAKSGFAVVGKATSAKEAIKLLSAKPAGVVLLDLQLGPEAIECLRQIRARDPGAAVVVLSDAGDKARIQTALAEGAAACVLKSGEPQDLVTAVRQALRRSVFFPTKTVEPGAPENTPDAGELTPRELEILRLVAEGASNVQVARKLWVTEQTVKFHLSNVYRKLGVSNRTEASRYAQLHGLLGEPAGRSERAD
jgi:DNA-binding NarL/FixJ family response regulator